MKSSGKRALAFILCLILCIGLLQAGALAATPLTVTGITASKTTACVGETITWTATATGGSGTLQYYFIIYKDGSKVTTRVYNTANTFSYIPMEPGTYKARVYVKDATDTKVNKLSTGVTVSEAAGPSITSITANKTTASVGSAITWTASASGGTGTLQYYFIIYKDGTNVKTRAYSTANTFSYTPTEVGTYKARVYVKDAAETKVNKLSTGVTVSEAAGPSITSITANKTTASVGSAITWTASASGGTGTLQYYFIIYKDGTNVKTRAYSTANTFSYTPTEVGTYKARVYVKDAAETKVNKLSTGVTVSEAAGPSITSITANKTTASVGSAITWTASASGGTGTLQYYFIIYKDGTNVKTRAYSTANTFKYTPTESGTYKARVYVKDATDTKVNKLSTGVTVTATELNAEQIYAKCSPAVFYIEVENKSGNVYASGSGFFISSDGTAVTNYHVIDGAYSATITLPSGAEYTVAGVYDYNEDEDWAILKINGSGFSYLGTGGALTVIGGAKCYAIGSPKGLQNTISEGIISNPAQNLGGMTYIQTTAAISHGSSGGALINKYGEVIGITSAGFDTGENLGFAIPISKINGYSHTQYTLLSVLFPGTSADDTPTALTAFNCLVDFVNKYYNGVISNTLMYSETQTTSTGNIVHRVEYDVTKDRIAVTRIETYNNQQYWTGIIYYPDSYIHSVVYFFYDTLYGSDPALQAYSYLYAPSFYGNNLSFTGININVGYNVATNESIASRQLQDALYFTDYILAKYYYATLGDIGVYLFGFTNFNLY